MRCGGQVVYCEDRHQGVSYALVVGLHRTGITRPLHLHRPDGSVGQWPWLNNAAPSLQLHYRAFITTTGCSAPALRFGTLALAVGAACGFSPVLGEQVLPFPPETPSWL